MAIFFFFLFDIVHKLYQSHVVVIILSWSWVGIGASVPALTCADFPGRGTHSLGFLGIIGTGTRNVVGSCLPISALKNFLACKIYLISTSFAFAYGVGGR